MANFDTLYQMVLESVCDSDLDGLDSFAEDLVIESAKDDKRHVKSIKSDIKNLFKESCKDSYYDEITSIRLDIYESCENGYISEFERDELLDIMTESFLDSIAKKFKKPKSDKTKTQDDKSSSQGINIKSEVNRLKNIRTETNDDKSKLDNMRKNLMTAKSNMTPIRGSLAT